MGCRDILLAFSVRSPYIRFMSETPKDKVFLGVLLPSELHEKLKEAAQKEERSVASYVRYLIRQATEGEQEQTAA